MIADQAVPGLCPSNAKVGRLLELYFEPDELAPKARLLCRGRSFSGAHISEIKRTALTLTCGIETPLPGGHFFEDKEGTRRKDIRLRWWEDLSNATYYDAAFPRSETVPRAPMVAPPRTTYPEDAPPVFFGHYWLPRDHPALLAPNVACLDFSMAKEYSSLCACRWDR